MSSSWRRLCIGTGIVVVSSSRWPVHITPASFITATVLKGRLTFLRRWRRMRKPAARKHARRTVDAHGLAIAARMDHRGNDVGHWQRSTLGHVCSIAAIAVVGSDLRNERSHVLPERSNPRSMRRNDRWGTGCCGITYTRRRIQRRMRP
jgi:hypothetical protein